LLNGYNGGPNPAQGVVVTNLLPPEVTYLSNSVNAAYTAGKLVWPIGNLALDQTATAQIWVRAGVAGSITSRAAIAASVADAGEPGYDQAVCITRVLGPVAITNVSATTLSNVSTVEWNTVVGVGYDIYMHDGTFTDKPSWGEREGTMLASENLRHFLDESAASTVDARFYQVTFADNTPSPSNIWGLIRREARPGFTLMAPPLITDRRFDGELGRMLAEQLQGNDGGMGAGGDEIYISNGGTGWRMLYLDAGKVWREANGDPCVYELPAGVGFWVARKSGTGVRITFTGQVGNEGTRTATLQPGFNLISLSEGKALPLKATFATANPVGADVEDAADQIVIQKANGSWRKLMYIQGWGAPYDGNWFDLTTFQIVPENEVLEPGAAYYYFRNGAATDVEF
jgi:hypothetical protein